MEVLKVIAGLVLVVVWFLWVLLEPLIALLVAVLAAFCILALALALPIIALAGLSRRDLLIFVTVPAILVSGGVALSIKSESMECFKAMSWRNDGDYSSGVEFSSSRGQHYCSAGSDAEGPQYALYRLVAWSDKKLASWFNNMILPKDGMDAFVMIIEGLAGIFEGFLVITIGYNLVWTGSVWILVHAHLHWVAFILTLLAGIIGISTGGAKRNE